MVNLFGSRSAQPGYVVITPGSELLQSLLSAPAAEGASPTPATLNGLSFADLLDSAETKQTADVDGAGPPGPDLTQPATKGDAAGGSDPARLSNPLQAIFA